jgi:hypothetical protein
MVFTIHTKKTAVFPVDDANVRQRTSAFPQFSPIFPDFLQNYPTLTHINKTPLSSDEAVMMQ